ncbi:MAG: trehalose-phosphatase [Deltaproteobacteria bacterium]|nr:trehalose-phosphatase [Deltaproteobacteria bacterium]
MTQKVATTYLFSDAGLEALRGFIDPETLFAFDLDGTLAPIAADPGGIRVPAAVQKALADLRKRAMIAIITGRSRKDAQRHLRVVPQYLVGNHGAEGLPGWEQCEEEFRRLTGGWEKQLRRSIPDDSDSGIVVENKGMSLSIHYRNAPDRRASRSLVLDVIGQLIPGPRVVGGKYVENLLPAEAPDKGEALMQLMRRAGREKGFFVGDDRTDEDVFRLDGDRLFTVRVGTGRKSQARFFLRGQREIPLLLRHINDALIGKGTGADPQSATVRP